MTHKYLVRYVILLLILLLCAGAAYLAEAAPDSHAGAVLAFRPEGRALHGRNAVCTPDCTQDLSRKNSGKTVYAAGRRQDWSGTAGGEAVCEAGDTRACSGTTGKTEYFAGRAGAA